MKRFLTIVGALTVLAGAVGGAYYYFVMRRPEPQVELYFDDGSMLALECCSADASPFVNLADDVLASSPVMA